MGQNRVVEINSHRKLIFDKDAKAINREEIVFSTRGAGKLGCPQAKNKKRKKKDL